MTKKIFVVDDDPFWIAILKKTLTSIGYHNVVSFANGAECISHLNEDPELVFLDYQMDDMNGLDVLKKIKEHNPAIGVIFCTAHQDLNVAMDAMKYGSCDYLLKENASKKEVMNIIEQLVNV